MDGLEHLNLKNVRKLNICFFVNLDVGHQPSLYKCSVRFFSLLVIFKVKVGSSFYLKHRLLKIHLHVTTYSDIFRGVISRFFRIEVQQTFIFPFSRLRHNYKPKWFWVLTIADFEFV